jgi:hypothetical protein
MPLTILEIGKQFRPSTSHVYPPFKKGRYMEEYVYDYLLSKKEAICTTHVYLPIFWTNLQNHPGFAQMKEKYQMVLDMALKKLPADTLYFTIVQHDDGPQLCLPKGTVIFGACQGTIPLPLIYEDTTHYLQGYAKEVPKTLVASFIGSYTHSIRKEMSLQMGGKKGLYWHGKDEWTVRVPEQDATLFIDKTIASRFCLAPRGYGRSSFRFFEAMLLDTVPVYIWDDEEWLPYKDQLDYSTFSISIHKSSLPQLYNILQSVSEETYRSMVSRIKEVRPWFTLEGMCDYIVRRIS